MTKENYRTHRNLWRWKNTLLDCEWVTEEMRSLGTRRIEGKWKHNMPESVGENTSSTKKQVYSCPCLHYLILYISFHCLRRDKATLRVVAGIDLLQCSEHVAHRWTTETHFQSSRENSILLQILWLCTQETFTDSIRNLLELINMFIRGAGCKINAQNQ